MDKTKRILITGGSGMVGQNLLENPELQNFKYYSPTRSELDLKNFHKVKRYLKEKDINFVINLAATVGGIQANIESPLKFLVDNIDINRNLILGAREIGIKKFLNIGSSCIYPKNIDTYIKEEQLLTGSLEPTNEGYALAKIVGIKLCESIVKEHAEYSYKTLIPCNMYGKFDSFDPRNSHLVSSIIYKLHHAKTMGEKTVEIWGDGNARREFMYAQDFCTAILHAINTFDTMPDLMNIGAGRDYSINEFYKVAAEAIGYEGSFEHNLEKPVGMMRKIVSIDRQIKWGWKPSVDLRAGISTTYQFYKKSLHS